MRTPLLGLVVLALALSVVALSGAFPEAVAADSVADFYRGKTVTIVVGFGAGGGYDHYARLLERHISKHIPGNPHVMVQNMPGAGSVIAANYLYNVAPRDGTVIGTFGRGIAFDQLLGFEGIQFQAREFNWIGSMNEEPSVCYVRADGPVQTFGDLFTTQILQGATGPGDTGYFIPLVLNELLGTRFRMIIGYPSTPEIQVAMERREVDGLCQSWSSVWRLQRDKVLDGSLRLLTLVNLRPRPEP